MEKANAEFVKFDSADVIATSGTIRNPLRYGFKPYDSGIGGALWRYTDSGAEDYNTQYTGNSTFIPSSSITDDDKYAYDYWKNVAKTGDSFTYDGGTYSTEMWTDVSKWLMLNSDDRTWSLSDRVSQ